MSVGGTEAIWFQFHSSLLLLRVGSTDETPGGLYISKSMGPSNAEVGPDYGPYWSEKGEGKVR